MKTCSSLLGAVGGFGGMSRAPIFSLVLGAGLAMALEVLAGAAAAEETGIFLAMDCLGHAEAAMRVSGGCATGIGRRQGRGAMVSSRAFSRLLRGARRPLEVAKKTH